MHKANGQEDSQEVFHTGCTSLLRNSSMPFCCLPNDQLNGLPWECLSQSQLENCWGNILSYWKWFPSNCHVPYLDQRISNAKQRELGSQGLGLCSMWKDTAFVWPRLLQSRQFKSSVMFRNKFQWWAVASRHSWSGVGSIQEQQLTLHSLLLPAGEKSVTSNTWLWAS